MSKKIALVISLLAVLSSCARLDYSRQEGGSVQTGVASWYGPDFHGKTTSSKEIYDMYDLTAAHRTLPFGTTVMVTNLDNGRSVTVRINDRGPFVGDRIIDLSYAAARLLGMIGPGTIPVRLDILKDVSPVPGGGGWSVQVGSFAVKENASVLAGKLKRDYRAVEISLFRSSTRVYHRVRIKAADEKTAMDLAQRLNEDGYAVIILQGH